MARSREMQAPLAAPGLLIALAVVAVLSPPLPAFSGPPRTPDVFNRPVAAVAAPTAGTLRQARQASPRLASGATAAFAAVAAATMALAFGLARSSGRAGLRRVQRQGISRVLVLGSTGRIGKEVVARVSKLAGFQVRAALHNVERSEYLKKLGAQEITKFDYQEPATWDAALDSVDVVYSASLDPLLEHHLKFCDFLGTKRSQIKQVVRISCMGADTNTACYDKSVHVSRDDAEIPLMLQHYWWGEEALIKNGLPVTVLRNNFFMNHLLKTDTENIDREGWFSNPLGHARNSFVCTNDIGEVAAKCIEEGPQKHADKFYDLTGPVPQSMFEIAEDLGKAMEKKVEYRPQSMKQFEEDFGATRAAFFEYLVNGFYTRCSPDFYNVVGRRPTTYAEYLTSKGAAGETGLEELYQANLWKKGVDAMKEAAHAKK